MILEKWRDSELYKKGLVELIPTSWIQRYRNINATKTTDLPDGSIVDIDGLYQDILQNGLRDSLVLGVGEFTRTVRLDSGNHRIQVAIKYGIEYLPTTVISGFHCIYEPENGPHVFDCWDDLIISCYSIPGYWRYLAPSKTFKSLKKYARYI